VTFQKNPLAVGFFFGFLKRVFWVFWWFFLGGFFNANPAKKALIEGKAQSRTWI
jgi:hypothetical protein